jgi:uncharacterized membrane protein YphA (DoxX/SURF4 family)
MLQAASKGGATSATRSARAPLWIARWIRTPLVYRIALLGLCAAYLQGGFDKAINFPGAVAEVQQFGLAPAVPLAFATITTELVGAALILTGFYRWIGALSLAGFTLMATFLANRFWEIPTPDRFMVENTFFEHLGLVGGFLLVAWEDVQERRPVRLS